SFVPGRDRLHFRLVDRRLPILCLVGWPCCCQELAQILPSTESTYRLHPPALRFEFFLATSCVRFYFPPKSISSSLSRYYLVRADFRAMSGAISNLRPSFLGSHTSEYSRCWELDCKSSTDWSSAARFMPASCMPT